MYQRPFHLLQKDVLDLVDAHGAEEVVRAIATVGKPSTSNQYACEENDNGVHAVYSADVMSEEIQEESIGNRLVACIKQIDDGRIVVLDSAGHALFVCHPRSLPKMDQMDINF